MRKTEAQRVPVSCPQGGHSSSAPGFLTPNSEWAPCSEDKEYLLCIWHVIYSIHPLTILPSNPELVQFEEESQVHIQPFGQEGNNGKLGFSLHLPASQATFPLPSVDLVLLY